MIFLLPTLGIIFFFIGILLVILLFLNDPPVASIPALWNDYLNHHFRHQNQEVSELLQSSMQQEVERKNRMKNISLAYTIAMIFKLFLYLVTGTIVLWQFRENWHLLTGQKFIFAIFYFLGFILIFASIFVGFRSYRFQELSTFSYISGQFSHLGEKLSSRFSRTTLTDDYQALAIRNLENEKILQTARYLFIFSLFNIIILALILSFYYHH